MMKIEVHASDKSKKEIQNILERYPDSRSALMPILFIIQDEKGFISIKDQLSIAKFLGIPPMKVRGVVEFYTMFRGEKCGKYLIQICHTLSCALMGAHAVVDVIREKLKIDVGETTKDGKFSLMKVECLGSCGTAPMMQINDDYYENLTKEKVIEILDSLD
jgi:NADH-quinone oxidoreductase subunit E